MRLKVTTWGAATQRRRKKPIRWLLALGAPFFLIIAIAMSVASGGGASAAAACQVVANGTVTNVGTGGAAGALTPLQVEQYWVNAGGPLDAAVTAAALAYAESADITDRIQDSVVSAPSVPTLATDALPPDQVGYGLWQITPGSPADYDPAVNAKIAVEKYQGSLAAGGGGWSPWTTYGTVRYEEALPAAQAAYQQLVASGAGGAGSVPVGLTTTTPTTSTTSTTSTTTAAASTPTIDTKTADQYITRLQGANDADYAIVEANGTVLAQRQANTKVDGGHITAAMLLVAYLRKHPVTPTGEAAAQLKAMIEDSSKAGGNWAYGQVGPTAVEQVATDAHMTDFHLDTWGQNYALDHSQVTAKDLALFFANVDTLIPAAVRSYGMGLLDNTPTIRQWGLLEAGLSGLSASAAGAVDEGTPGWTVNQGAQLTIGQYGTVGVAITVTASPSRSAGQNAVQNIGTDLLGTATADNLGYGIDLSSLSARQQTEIYNAASAMASSGTGQCSNVSVNTPVPTVPGKIATIDPTTGLAAAPTDLPPGVETTIAKLIAAGNQIHSLPYIWGGGHGAPLTELQAGYDCSGSTSYVLWQAGLLSTPEAMVSYDYNTWGAPGPGKYVTVFSDTSHNPGHVFLEVDGILFDTAHYGPTEPAGSGPRWMSLSGLQAQLNGGDGSGTGTWIETHPPGL